VQEVGIPLFVSSGMAGCFHCAFLFSSCCTGTGVTVQTGATVTFAAPVAKLLPGFHAEEGATVFIEQ